MPLRLLLLLRLRLRLLDLLLPPLTLLDKQKGLFRSEYPM
jgi:hypothetical protein